jgi:hypothetical protein
METEATIEINANGKLKVSTSESESEPLRFNVDCEGLDFDTYQFLLGDIAQAIEDGNRMYFYGEPGYVGPDGNFHPFSDSDQIITTSTTTNKPKNKRRKKRDRPLVEQVAIATGLVKIHPPNPTPTSTSVMEVKNEVNR